jgi:predicted dehydrogenase
MTAFRYGKHVLVEKPMDIRLSKARQLCEAAKKSGKQFGIMFNQRTGKLFGEARRIVQSGELGQLKRSVWIITNWYRTQHYYDSGTWRATWAGEGGGVLVNQAPHQLDLWQWICGMPEQITAFCTEAKYHNIEVEDDATVIARFPGGAEGVFITTTGEYPGTNRLEISGSKGKLVLENGLLKWWKLKQDEREFCYASEKSFAHIDTEYLEIEDETNARGHQKILQNFTNSILHDEPLLAPGYDGIRELTIQNAAYLSAWKGNLPVELPFDESEYDAMLEQKQSKSVFSTGNGPDAKHTQYSERWQIKW